MYGLLLEKSRQQQFLQSLLLLRNLEILELPGASSQHNYIFYKSSMPDIDQKAELKVPYLGIDAVSIYSLQNLSREDRDIIRNKKMFRPKTYN